MRFTDREKAICILSHFAALKINPTQTVLACKEIGLDKDTLRQAVLDLDEFLKQIQGKGVIS